MGDNRGYCQAYLYTAWSASSKCIPRLEICVIQVEILQISRICEMQKKLQKWWSKMAPSFRKISTIKIINEIFKPPVFRHLCKELWDISQISCLGSTFSWDHSDHDPDQSDQVIFTWSVDPLNLDSTDHGCGIYIVFLQSRVVKKAINVSATFLRTVLYGCFWFSPEQSRSFPYGSEQRFYMRSGGLATLWRLITGCPLYVGVSTPPKWEMMRGLCKYMTGGGGGGGGGTVVQW